MELDLAGQASQCATSAALIGTMTLTDGVGANWVQELITTQYGLATRLACVWAYHITAELGVDKWFQTRVSLGPPVV